MKRMQLLIFAALFSVVATSPVLAVDEQAVRAAAQQPAAPTAPTPGAKKPPANADDEVVCKREDELGSRLSGKKVCMTRRDWRRQSTDAGDSVNNAPRPH